MPLFSGIPFFVAGDACLTLSTVSASIRQIPSGVAFLSG
jgi:hypothetical protein